jgi:hypothetical protein
VSIPALRDIDNVSVARTSQATAREVVCGDDPRMADNRTDPTKVAKAGDTMTGLLTLGSDTNFPAKYASATNLRLCSDGQPTYEETVGFGSDGHNHIARAIGGGAGAWSPTASGQAFTRTRAHGYQGSAVHGFGGECGMFADGLWSASNRGTYHAWSGTPNGSTTMAEWMRLQGGILMPQNGPAWSTGGLTGEPTGKHLAIGYDAAGSIGYVRSTNSGTAYTELRLAGSSVTLWTGSGSAVKAVDVDTNGVVRLLSQAYSAPGNQGVDATGDHLVIFNALNQDCRIGVDGSASMWLKSLNASGASMKFYTSPYGGVATLAMTIDAAQNVGIGGAPVAGNGKLQVFGAQTLDLGSGTLPAFTSHAASGLLLAAADGSYAELNCVGFGGIGLVLRGSLSGGTRAAPTATPTDAFFHAVRCKGYDGAAWSDSVLADIRADGAWSASNHGIKFEWGGCVNGSTTIGAWMHLQNGNLGIGAAPTAGAGKLQVSHGTAFNPATGDYAALRILGSYGGGLTLVDGSKSWTAWAQNGGAEFVIGFGATNAARTALLTLYDGSCVGINGTPTTNNGRLQLSPGGSPTTKADGIAFGSDTFLYREGVGALRADVSQVAFLPAGSANFTMFIRGNGSGYGAGLEIGSGGSGNRNALIDLTGDDTYTDFGLRIIRTNGGANAISEMTHRGTGAYRMITFEAAPLEFYTSNAVRMQILSNGVVLVGNATDGCLQVPGRITAKVNAAGASMTSVAEIAAYIRSILT